MNLILERAPLLCPECGLALHARRTREGVLRVCPRCQGHWDARPQTFLTPLLAQALEQRERWRREGRCALGRHELQPPEEHCALCPQSPHRCPTCATRLFLSEPRGSSVKVCPRCPGLWLSATAWAALRQTPSPTSLGVSLGTGGSIQRGPSVWRARGVILVGLVISAAVTGALEALLQLLGALFRGN